MSIRNDQFEYFYNNYYFRALSLVTKKLSNRQDAEDLIADSFLYCYDHFDSYDESKASLGTWLYIIIGTRIKKYYRDRKQTVDLEEIQELADTDSTLIERAAELTEIRSALADALLLLPENQRKLVVLRYFRCLSTSEAAAVMKMSEANVRTQLSRALAKIKQYFISIGLEG